MPFDNSFYRLKNIYDSMQNMFNPPGFAGGNAVDILRTPMGSDLPEQGGFLGMPPGVPLPTVDDLNFGKFESPIPSVVQPQDITAADYQFESGYEPEIDTNQRMLELYKPEYTASQRLNELLAQAPERNKPGIGRKIAASLLGFGGRMKEADQALYDPYYNAVEDWKLRVDPAYRAAQLERQSNVLERQVSADILRGEREQRNYKLNVRKQEEVERKNKEAERVREFRAQAYDFKSRNPQWKAFAVKGGNLVYVNPLDPTQVVDTKVPTGTLSDMDRITLQAENAEDLAHIRGKYQLGGIAARGEETRKNISLRDTLKEEGLTGKSEKPLTPSAKGTDIINKAGELKNTDPELGRFIEIDGRKVTIKKPGTRKGPTEEQFHRINQAIYGTTGKLIGRVKAGEVERGGAPSAPSTAPSRGPSTGMPTPKYPSGPKIKNPDDRIVVLAPDGNRYSLPREQKAQAVAKGYKVVQE